VKNINTDLKVGLFIVAGFVVLFFMTFKIGGMPFFSSNGGRFISVYFNTISGVSEKSHVKMAGVGIGKVRSITLEGRKAKVTIDLDADYRIPVDSTATIRSAGLLGEKYIEIIPGADGTYLKNGESLAKSIDPTNIDEMMQKLSLVFDDVKTLSHALSKFFSDDETGGGLHTIIDNLAEITNSMSRLMTANEEKLDSIIANAEQAMELMKEILGENRENLTSGIADFREASGNLNEVINDNREDFRLAMKNLKESSEKLDGIMGSIKQVSAKIEKGEGTLGRLIQDEELYDNINETLTGAQGFMGKIDRLKIGLGLRSEQQFDLEKSKSYFSVRIQPREDKYYLLELSEDTRRTDITTTRNTINSILYTMLLAKRYGDVTLKGGLIESGGGIELDNHAWRDTILFSAEAFNLGGYDINAPNPQVKLTARYYFQKYLYVYVGGDELLNDYYRTFIAGVGIMADEDDFKFLLSLF